MNSGMFFRKYQYRISSGEKNEGTGSVETRVSKRGRKCFLKQTDIKNIDDLIKAQPDITIHEINEKLQLSVSDETI